MARYQPYLLHEYDPLRAGSIDGTDDEPHDNAVCRALAARYKPSKRLEGDPALTLFVGRLAPNTEEDALYEAFRQFGKIKSHRLVRDVVTGFSKCYGFVEFASDKAFQRAYQEGHNMSIDEKEVLVDCEHERVMKNWVPRRLGGGFGGRKQSGQLRFGCRDRPFLKPIMAAPLRQPRDRRTDGREGRQSSNQRGGGYRGSHERYSGSRRDNRNRYPSSSRSNR